MSEVAISSANGGQSPNGLAPLRPQVDTASSSVRHSERLQNAIVLLSLTGVAVAIELTRIHYMAHTVSGHHSLCAINDSVNCDTVALSSFSVFFGVPVSVWGIFGYLWIGALALWGSLSGRKRLPWPWTTLLASTALALAASAVLAFIAATRINSLCVFCLASYLINAALFMLALMAWRRRNRMLAGLVAGDLWAFRARPVVAALFALGALCGAFTLTATFPAYWEVPALSVASANTQASGEHGQHWIGAAHPSVTIVEFSDYECPHCRVAHERIRAKVAEYPKQLRLVHRHLPLDGACNPQITQPFHRNACRFAEAAECAGFQGRFWEMNDQLFSAQQHSEADGVDLEQLASHLGLDSAAFGVCMREHRGLTRIRVDIDEATSRNLKGTPSYFIGKKLYLGGIPDVELQRLLDASRSLP